MRLMALLLALTMLIGCGSSPLPNHYLLTANAPPASDVTSELTIGLGPVFVADFLERPQVVTNSGSNRLEVDDLHRWAEPLDAGILRVMVVNMAELLGTERVSVFPWRRDETPDVAVRIILIELDHLGGQAQLGVRWVVVDVASDTVVSQNLSRYTQRSTRGPQDLVQSYSDLFAELAADIASEIRALEDTIAESG